MRRRLCAGIPCAAQVDNPRDAGFGLIEILVSMVVFTIVMLALLPVMVSSKQAMGLSRERQTANGYATGALENVQAAATTPSRLRDIVTGRATGSGNDPYITCSPTCRFTPSFDSSLASSVSSERVLVSGSDDSLTTQRCSTASGCTKLQNLALSGIVFTTRLYVTTAAASTSLVNVTAVTSWTSQARTGTLQAVAVRTQLGPS